MRCRAHQATTRLHLVLRRDLTRQFSLLVEISQRLEKAENFWLREDVREDSKVDAELLKTFEVHLETPVSIVLEKWKHGLVHYTQHVNDAFIL